MTDILKKPHTPAYTHLKKVAEGLVEDFSKAQRVHSQETLDDVRASCLREWQDAVRYVISPKGLNEPGRTIRAAKRRLKVKNLLQFLDKAESAKIDDAA